LSSMGIHDGYDLRRLIILLIVVSSVSAAYFNNGRRQAFWLSFALVMLVMAVSIFHTTPVWPVPNFGWAITIKPDKNYPKFFFVSESVRAVGTIITAMIAGFIGDYIYGQTHSSD
jgi:hypothetical protein